MKIFGENPLMDTYDKIPESTRAQMEEDAKSYSFDDFYLIYRLSYTKPFLDSFYSMVKAFESYKHTNGTDGRELD